MGADGSGMFYYEMTAAQFKAGNLRHIPCRWCSADIELQFPMRFFMCWKCDRGPMISGTGDLIPRSFLDG